MNAEIQLLIDRCGTDLSGKWVSVEKIPTLVELVKESIYNRVKEELIDDASLAEESQDDQIYLRGCNGGIVDSLFHIKQYGIDQ